MRRVAQYTIISTLVILLFAGCEEDAVSNGINEGHKECPEFTATISSGVWSRAFDQMWEAEDMIGISGCNRKNVCYYTKDNAGKFVAKTQGDQIYFLNEEEETFTAYYPWKALEAETELIKADTRNQDEQKKFDYLWSNAKGKKTDVGVSFNFGHMMTKVMITLKPGVGVSIEEFKNAECILKGFRYAGSFNVVDGSTTVEEGEEEWPFFEYGNFNESDGIASFSFIFFPQLFENPLILQAQLKSDSNRSHILKVDMDFTAANRLKDGAEARNEWIAGRQYNLSVTLNKTEMTLNECAINPWTDVKGEDITVD